MKNNRSSYLSTRRDSWVEINLGNIEYNICELKRHIRSGQKILAVIKADAYGHGAVMTAPTLIASGVSMLGVASLDEGIQLRENKIDLPVLVLGAVPIWSFDMAAKNNITISIFSDQHLEAAKLTYEKTGKKTKAHIKIDTGMNRIGISPDLAADFIKKVQKSDFIELEGIFTHFACAESREKTQKQIETFKNIIKNIDTSKLLIHCSNTAALLAYDTSFANMVRVGIGIYGLLPDFPLDYRNPPNLKQVIGLKGRVVNIHKVKTGEGVSYSHTFQAEKPVKIATIPIGYADGVPRALSNKLVGKLNGKEIKQIGNITMDQMMFDITEIEAQEGDIITLLDETLPIDVWAKEIGTINYELTCRLKVRLSRVFTR